MANGDFTLQVSLVGYTNAGTLKATALAKSFTSITDAIVQQISIPTSSVDILTTGGEQGGGVEVLKAVIIKNCATSNFITVGVLKAVAKAAWFKVKAGDILVLCDELFDCDDDGVVLGSLEAMTKITAIADTGACTIELMAIGAAT